MEKLKIHDWDEHQTYRKDRGQPPWIKVHRHVMRNIKWVALDDSERGQLVAIWLLAADHNGVIPASPELVQKLCFMSSKPNLSKFIDLGFLDGDGCHDDANVTPDRRQSDQPKAETETETETEEEKPLGPSGDAPRCSVKQKNGYSHAFEAAWADYPRRAGGNSKAEAFKKWNARLKEGKTEQAMHAGVKRYAEFVRSDGKEGTQYVQQAATFFGPGMHFEEAWVPAKEITQLDVDMECNPEKQRELARRFLAQERAKPMPDWMRERL